MDDERSPINDQPILHMYPLLLFCHYLILFELYLNQLQYGFLLFFFSENYLDMTLLQTRFFSKKSIIFISITM